MAHAEALPDKVLDKILEQVVVLLHGAFDSVRLRGAEIGLHETFDIWVLDADAVIRPTYDLRLLANPTGRWHHQVSINGAVEAFARSVPLGATPDSWRVVEVFRSPLAGKVDEAIERIDREAPDDPLTRLLIVPAYQVHAFWLLNDVERVFVIDRPARFANLHTDRLLSYDEFLDALRGDQHIIGRIRQ